MKKTLLIVSHPNMANSKFNKALVQEVEGLENLTIRHLEGIYGSDIKAFDVQKEQELLLGHDRIVFQFPWYWYSTPAMLKAYQDEVFTYGFAYGSTGDKLNGKEFKVAITIGGAEYAYQAGGWNNFSINELLTPLRQTANLTGMKFTRGFFLYGVGAMSEDELKQKAKEYKEVLLDDEWDNGLEKYLRIMNEDNVKGK